MLSLVIPIYRNEENISHLLESLIQLRSTELELVFVIDGSPDRSYQILKERLPTFPIPSQLLLLSRNFGSHLAVRAGLEAASGLFFAVLCADSQEPIELALEMYRILKADQADIVIATPTNRNDPLFTQLSSRIFWWFYRRFVIPEIPPGGVGLFGCNRAFRDQVLVLDEHHSSLIAQIFWMGFRRCIIPYERKQRLHGKSAWTFSKKVRYLADSIFAFTDLPIRLLIWAGGITASLSGLFGALVIVAKILGWISVPGYCALILTIVFLGSVNLLSIGIVGSYVWRSYENTKARPLHIVMRRHEFRS